jgi:hypothetical protein
LQGITVRRLIKKNRPKAWTALQHNIDYSAISALQAINIMRLIKKNRPKAWAQLQHNVDHKSASALRRLDCSLLSLMACKAEIAL